MGLSKLIRIAGPIPTSCGVVKVNETSDIAFDQGYKTKILQRENSPHKF